MGHPSIEPRPTRLFPNTKQLPKVQLDAAANMLADAFEASIANTRGASEATVSVTRYKRITSISYAGPLGEVLIRARRNQNRKSEIVVRGSGFEIQSGTPLAVRLANLALQEFQTGKFPRRGYEDLQRVYSQPTALVGSERVGHTSRVA